MEEIESARYVDTETEIKADILDSIAYKIYTELREPIKVEIGMPLNPLTKE